MANNGSEETALQFRSQSSGVVPPERSDTGTFGEKQEQEMEQKENKTNNNRREGEPSEGDDDDPVVVDPDLEGADPRAIAAAAVAAAAADEEAKTKAAKKRQQLLLEGPTGLNHENLDQLPAPLSLNPFWLLTGLAIAAVGITVFICCILWLTGLQPFYPTGPANDLPNDEEHYDVGGWLAVASICLVIGFVLVIVGAVVARLWTVTEKEEEVDEEEAKKAAAAEEKAKGAAASPPMVPPKESPEPVAQPKKEPTNKKPIKYIQGISLLQVLLRCLLWLGLVILFGILLFLSVVGVAMYQASRTVPDYKAGRVSLGHTQISDKVRIIRSFNKNPTTGSDGFAIPEIVAETELDAYFGLGVVHAMDRLGQIELLRLLTKGRLSKYLGKTTIPSDRAARTLGFERTGKQNCAMMSRGNRDKMQSYVNGLNYFVAKFPDEKPPEFLLLGKLLIFNDLDDVFTIEDVCTMTTALQYSMSLNVNHEVSRWKLFNKGGLNYSQIEELMPMTLETDPARVGVVQEAPGASVLSSSSIPTLTQQLHRTRNAEAMRLEQRIYDESMNIFRDRVVNSASGSPSAKGHKFTAQQQRERQHEKEEAFKKMDGAKKESSSPAKFLTSLLMQVISSTTGRTAGPILDPNMMFNNAGTSKFAGSNSWFTRSKVGSEVNVVGGGDPHLNIDAPSVWYPTKISFYNDTLPFVSSQTQSRYVHRLTGCTIPGIPALMIGRSDFVAWGVTLSYGDLNDLYVMQPSPRAPGSHYVHDGQEKLYVRRHERIEILGGDTDDIEVVESIYGPDVSSIFELSDHHRLCLMSQTLSVPDATSIDAALGTISPSIRSVADFQSIVHQFQSPGLGLCMGDRDGTIGWALAGRHPDRRPHLTGHTGRFPILGNGSFDYHLITSPSGYVPTANRPYVLDSNVATMLSGTSVYVATANHRITAAGWTMAGATSVPPISYDFHASYRGERIAHVLGTAPAAELATLLRHQQLQRDQTSTVWNNYIGHRMHSGDANFGSKIVPLLDANGVAMLNHFHTIWSSEGYNKSSIGRQEPTLLWRWLRTLSSKLTPEVLSLLELTTWREAEYSVHQVLGISGADPTSPIEFDPITLARCRSSEYATPLATASNNPNRRPADCFEVAAREWNIVARQFVAGGVSKWGIDNSKLRVKHVLFSALMPFRPIYDFTLTKGGDRSSVDVALISNSGYSSEEEDGRKSRGYTEFDYTVTASCRWVYRFVVGGNESTSEVAFTFPGGVSGHGWSPHYHDIAYATTSEKVKNTTDQSLFYVRAWNLAPVKTPFAMPSLLAPTRFALLNNFSVPEGFSLAEFTP